MDEKRCCRGHLLTPETTYHYMRKNCKLPQIECKACNTLRVQRQREIARQDREAQR